MSLAETTSGAAEQLEVWEATPQAVADQDARDAVEHPAAPQEPGEPEQAPEAVEWPQPQEQLQTQEPHPRPRSRHEPAWSQEPVATEEPVDEPVTAEEPEHPAFEELDAPQALREPAVAWWAAVNQVHEVLLAGDAGLEAVSAAFAVELRARWEYAKALHEHGYHVPEYLAERAPIAPLWPLPETPMLVDKLTRAA